MKTPDDFRLDGKVALVTGGARGIGLECARALAAAGCRVVLTDVLDAQGAAATEQLASDGGDAIYRSLDVTHEDRWADVVDATLSRFGRWDILVNNAGIELVAEIGSTSQADFRKIMAVNVEGVFLGCRSAVAAMRPGGPAGQGGSIVNLSSVAGLRGVSRLSAYGASKGAVRLLTKDVAIECAQFSFGIRCNSVHPGVVQTDMADSFFAKHLALGLGNSVDDVKTAFVGLHPMGHLGSPRDVANAVRFLASDASKWVTGIELSVDGGWAAR